MADKIDSYDHTKDYTLDGFFNDVSHDIIPHIYNDYFQLCYINK
jgi:hypothetical protein